MDKDLLELLQMNKVGYIKQPRFDATSNRWVMRLTDEELFSVKKFAAISIGTKFQFEIERINNLNTGNKVLPIYIKTSDRGYKVCGGFPRGTYLPDWKGFSSAGNTVRVVT